MNINNCWWTFQGEGKHAGRRALFVRMPFCNLACSWCDTEFNTFKKWTEDELLFVATSEPARFCVLTGGEPMMNKHSPHVIAALKGARFEIACESNGTFPILGGIDFATVSPKRDADFKVNTQAFARADEFKYVVDQQFDFSLLDRHRNDGRIYSLSPEYGHFKENLEKIYQYIKEHPWWRISLQTHKWMGIA